MGCCGQKGVDVFEYDKHDHILTRGNINHSNCKLCNEDIPGATPSNPAGFSYYCQLCNYNLCLNCKLKEEQLQNEARQRAQEEERKRKEEEERKRREEEEKRKKEQEKNEVKKKRNLRLEQ